MNDEQKLLDYGVKNVCTNCAKLGECGKGVDCDFLRIVRDCYEEAIEIGREEKGLAEGRKEKWHEIETHVKPSREIEKKYMPKSNQKVMLKYHFYNDDEIHYSDGYYDCYDFEFHIPNNPTGKIICVIAWCELPKFEE